MYRQCELSRFGSNTSSLPPFPKHQLTVFWTIAASAASSGLGSRSSSTNAAKSNSSCEDATQAGTQRQTMKDKQEVKNQNSSTSGGVRTCEQGASKAQPSCPPSSPAWHLTMSSVPQAVSSSGHSASVVDRCAAFTRPAVRFQQQHTAHCSNARTLKTVCVRV